MLEIMTKERMKKSGEVKRRPAEADRSAEQNSGSVDDGDVEMR